ncbi:MAG: sialidase family protein [Bacteroidales bacterium]
MTNRTDTPPNPSRRSLSGAWLPLALMHLVLSFSPLSAQDAPLPSDAIRRSGFLYDEAPFPSAHASTLAESGNHILAAWFGGTAEGRDDVCIWLSRFDGSGWSDPVKVADGIQADGTRFPCWNPVLFQVSSGPLLLFYKVGPNPREWWGMVRASDDGGLHWSAAVRLPAGILGPIRAKPLEIDGTLLAGSSTEHDGWVVHMERLGIPHIPAYEPDRAKRMAEETGRHSHWTRGGSLNDPEEFGAIQPTLLWLGGDSLRILCRSRQGVITCCDSPDRGVTWGPMTATSLPNPSAGIDALRLTDGRFLLVYNPLTDGREKLALAQSADGRHWQILGLLENAPGEYSYPALIQASDGLVHISYTWRRERIRHLAIDPSLLPGL